MQPGHSLSDVFVDSDLRMTAKHDESKSWLIEVFDIDSLVEPFRNHHHKAPRSAFGDRRTFQEVYGLGKNKEMKAISHIW